MKLSLSWIALLGVAACQDTGGEGGERPLKDKGSDGTDSAAPGQDTAPPGAPNLLIISVDTVRPDWLGYWTGDPTTPAIDAFLSKSLVLENHRSCSNWTFHSIVCAQAGTEGFNEAYIPAVGKPESLPTSFLLASEVIYQAGWQTALVSTNSYFSDINQNADGFEQINYMLGRKADANTQAALTVHSSFSPSRPWYLHVHYLDPHSPYNPPAEYQEGLEGLPEIPYNLRRSADYEQMEEDWEGLDAQTQADILENMRALYLAEYSFTDAEIGRLLEDLDALGAMENTLVLFFTDHGEQFAEHSKFGHGESPFEQENRSIAALSGPGVTPGAWTGPTTHIDLWPTLFPLLGVETPDSFIGVPVGDRPDRGFILSVERKKDGDHWFAAHRGDAKMIYWWSGRKYLYHLDHDPGETDNRYNPTDPEVIASWEFLTPYLDAFYAAHPEYGPAVTPGP